MQNPKRFLVSGIVLVLTAVLAASAQQEAPWQEREFVTTDGSHLFAWLHCPPVEGKVPLVITLPMRGHTHDSYGEFHRSLQAFVASDSTGKLSLPYLLSFDLRGHGKSVARGEEQLDFRSMTTEEYKKIPGDIAEAAARVIADSSLRIDPEQVIVIGASIGANSAIMLTEQLPGVQKVVMLSPGRDYLGLVPEKAFEKFRGRILIYTAEKDSRSLEGSEHLVEFNRERCTLKVFTGGDHGTDIINNDRQATNELIAWVLDN
jgi:hypothetical protein